MAARDPSAASSGRARPPTTHWASLRAAGTRGDWAETLRSTAPQRSARRASAVAFFLRPRFFFFTLADGAAAGTASRTRPPRTRELVQGVCPAHLRGVPRVGRAREPNLLAALLLELRVVGPPEADGAALKLRHDRGHALPLHGGDAARGGAGPLAARPRTNISLKILSGPADCSSVCPKRRPSRKRGPTALRAVDPPVKGREAAWRQASRGATQAPSHATWQPASRKKSPRTSATSPTPHSPPPPLGWPSAAASAPRSSDGC